ncbi:MAG: single-stranded-DNA-specific exonuclease RecJ [Pseudohongiellaceae bacterium]
MNVSIRRREDGSEVKFSDSLHPLLQRIYRQRDISHADELVLSLDKLLPPDSMKGLDQAIELLWNLLRDQGRVLIVSDFDADGATSCALVVSALRSFGFSHVDYIVPNRFDYGYGLTSDIVALASTRSPGLIITVDNGISSVEGVAAAQAAGIKVLVTDHHLPGSVVPSADAIVNPNQTGCEFPSKALAGVGVAFYLMLAFRRWLREAGWFEKKGLAEPVLADLLDLVALGTVADVVPLDYNNRILVNEGLKRMRAGRVRPGILALLQVSGRNVRTLLSSDLGFAVGPRLNAAGRLDDMATGIECLLAQDADAAYELARLLDSLNKDRKLIESDMREQAFAALDRVKLDENEVAAGICVYDCDWHQGVVGILASRIKDRYHRPVIAFADANGTQNNEPAELKGSARSIPGFHIRDALEAISTQHPGLLTRFGGHAMAAGLSLQHSRLEQFTRCFEQEAARRLSADQLQAKIVTDGEIEAVHLTLATAREVLSAGPWGQGFPEPVFDGIFTVTDQRLVGGKHLKLVVSPEGLRLDIEAIAFNIDLALWPCDAEQVHLVYRLDINEYRGHSKLQLMVEHITLAVTV